MKQEKISVVIPVYNVDPYLECCISSVLDNDYDNLEVICVDDGSSDNSLEILKKLAEHDHRINVISQKNAGVSVARNTGIEVATGDWLYYLDADDWIHKDSFRILTETAQKSGADVIFGGYRDVVSYSAQDKDARLETPDTCRKMSVAEITAQTGMINAAVWGTLYRKSCINKLRFPVGVRRSEDTFYNVMMLTTCPDITFARVDLPLYFYFHGRSEAVTQNYSGNDLLANVKWWMEQLNTVQKTDYMLCRVYDAILGYRHAAFFSKNPEVGERNVGKCFRQADRWLLKNKTLSMRFRIRFLLYHLPIAVYRAYITQKDPTAPQWEKMMRNRHENDVLKLWENV